MAKSTVRPLTLGHYCLDAQLHLCLPTMLKECIVQIIVSNSNLCANEKYSDIVLFKTGGYSAGRTVMYSKPALPKQ